MRYKANKNVVRTKEQAESINLLTELLQLRDHYRDGWIPDWVDSDTKYSIIWGRNRLGIDSSNSCTEIFFFSIS